MKYLRAEADFEKDSEFHLGAQFYVHRHFLYSREKEVFLPDQWTPYHAHLEIGLGIVYLTIAIGREYAD